VLAARNGPARRRSEPAVQRADDTESCGGQPGGGGSFRGGGGRDGVPSSTALPAQQPLPSAAWGAGGEELPHTDGRWRGVGGAEQVAERRGAPLPLMSSSRPALQGPRLSVLRSPEVPLSLSYVEHN
jgi:hypothetical protein